MGETATLKHFAMRAGMAPIRIREGNSIKDNHSKPKGYKEIFERRGHNEA